jgi:hypothetical protein
MGGKRKTIVHKPLIWIWFLTIILSAFPSANNPEETTQPQYRIQFLAEKISTQKHKCHTEEVFPGVAFLSPTAEDLFSLQAEELKIFELCLRLGSVGSNQARHNQNRDKRKRYEKIHHIFSSSIFYSRIPLC